MTYDVNGNPLTYRGYTMTWAKGRQLSALTGNGLTMSFKYDNNSIRTKKTVNGVETEYFYVGDTLVSQKTGNEVINFAYTAGGAPYGFTYNGTSYFYLTNIQGDIIGIYDSTGTVVVEYTYDSWGKLISITGSLADTIGVKNPLRYRGYYYDTETSLYYLQARYYDPDICRFISADALLVAGNDYIQGTNRYAYCYNNPVMYFDPSGYAVDGSTDSVVEDILYSLFSVLILKTIVRMSDEDIVCLVNEIEDSGDLFYVSMVIYSSCFIGPLNPSIMFHDGIKGKTRFEVCRAFTNKKVCLIVGEYYAYAYKGEGNAQIGIAQEIYAHAIIYYYSQNVTGMIDLIKTGNPEAYDNTPSFKLIEYLASDVFVKRTDCIDLGEEGLRSDIFLSAYDFLWNNF